MPKSRLQRKAESAHSRQALRRTILLGLVVALAGCQPHHVQKPPKEMGAVTAQVVNLSPGDSTQYSPSPKRQPQWYVQWQKGAQANLTSKGEISQGTMQGVTGYVIDHGKPGSTFESIKGWGNQGRQELVLAGDVHVRSPKPAAELICDRLVYYATDKVFHAEGNVRLVGKVGTIGTLSQLWATHDLKIVATPDMFTARLGLILLTSVVGGWSTKPSPNESQKAEESRFRYVDAKKNLTIQAHRARADQTDPKTDVLQLQGDVSIASLSQGFTLTADRVKCITAEDGQGRAEIRHAYAWGHVHMVKTVTSAGAKRVTDIRGSTGELNVNRAGDVVRLSGPVRIESISESSRRTMLATGSAGVVTLDPAAESGSGSGLREGSLQGPVTVTLNGPPEKGATQPSHVLAVGDRMEFSNTGPHSAVILTGHVEIHGEGNSALGQMTSLARAILRLNPASEVVGWEVG